MINKDRVRSLLDIGVARLRLAARYILATIDGPYRQSRREGTLALARAHDDVRRKSSKVRLNSEAGRIAERHRPLSNRHREHFFT